MTFDITTHQRERIRELERENHGLELLRDHMIRVVAGVIVDMDARAQVEAMSQDEFMRALATAFQDEKQEEGIAAA